MGVSSSKNTSTRRTDQTITQQSFLWIDQVSVFLQVTCWDYLQDCYETSAFDSRLNCEPAHASVIHIRLPKWVKVSGNQHVVSESVWEWTIMSLVRQGCADCGGSAAASREFLGGPNSWKPNYYFPPDFFVPSVWELETTDLTEHLW